MKGLLVSFLATLLLCSAAIAESKAKEARGGSCTDHCTSDGKFVFAEDKLLGLEGHEPLASHFAGEDPLDQDLKAYDRLHTRVERANDACSSYIYAVKPGNLKWCIKNCMSAGGLKSRFTGRAGKVKEFIEQRTKVCEAVKKDLMESGIHWNKDGYLSIHQWDAGEQYIWNKPL